MSDPHKAAEAAAEGEQWANEALESLRGKLQARRRGPTKVYVVGGFAFVPHPAARGVWIRTHPCVVQVDCGYCKMKIGVPCEGRDGYMASTHSLRRKAARKVPRLGEVAELQITVK